MAEKITVMRSPLGRVRGTGAAKAGVEHWWAERVGATALVPLTLWFLISVLSMLGAEQPAVAAWIARPWNATLLIILVALTFHHAQLGLQVVFEDYMDNGWRRTAAILSVKGASLFLALLGALSVLKLALGAH